MKWLICLIYFYLQVLDLTVQCWQYYLSLNDIILNTEPEMELTHSTYYFGDCKHREEELTYFDHTHLEHMDILGKPIVRGWLNIKRIPKCIILRATSYEAEMFRNTAYNFQICVPRITYCHTQRRYKYFYYEWYIPPDMYGGMNWDLYFYGPTELTWQ